MSVLLILVPDAGPLRQTRPLISSDLFSQFLAKEKLRIFNRLIDICEQVIGGDNLAQKTVFIFQPAVIFSQFGNGWFGSRMPVDMVSQMMTGSRSWRFAASHG